MFRPAVYLEQRYSVEMSLPQHSPLGKEDAVDPSLQYMDADELAMLLKRFLENFGNITTFHYIGHFAFARLFSPQEQPSKAMTEDEVCTFYLNALRGIDRSIGKSIKKMDSHAFATFAIMVAFMNGFGRDLTQAALHKMGNNDTKFFELIQSVHVLPHRMHLDVSAIMVNSLIDYYNEHCRDPEQAEFTSTHFYALRLAYYSSQSSRRIAKLVKKNLEVVAKRAQQDLNLKLTQDPPFTQGMQSTRTSPAINDRVGSRVALDVDNDSRQYRRRDSLDLEQTAAPETTPMFSRRFVPPQPQSAFQSFKRSVNNAVASLQSHSVSLSIKATSTPVVADEDSIIAMQTRMITHKKKLEQLHHKLCHLMKKQRKLMFLWNKMTSWT